MEWALAIVALTVLGVAAISRRLSGTPVTPAMVFVAVGLLVGPEVLGGIDLESSSATVRSAGGSDARAGAVLRRLAHRSRAASPRDRGAVAPARDRTAADDRARRARGGGDLRPADRSRRR